MPAATTERGYATDTGGSFWHPDYEDAPELRWPLSVWVYDAMRRQDAQVASVLRAVTLPVRRTAWRIDPAGSRPEVARLVADDLGLPLVGEQPAAAARTRDRQRADRRGLVNDDQHRAVPAELVEQLPQPGLIVGQRPVVQPLADRIKGDGMVLALPTSSPTNTACVRSTPGPSQASLGLAATIGAGCRQPRYEETCPKAALSLSAVHRRHRDR